MGQIYSIATDWWLGQKTQTQTCNNESSSQTVMTLYAEILEVDELIQDMIIDSSPIEDIHEIQEYRTSLAIRVEQLKKK
ncbi:MAG: hypothetical protein Sylvanvirus2_38 [Sylvanvirus sp.]|uniref:Uncharacterized protein n=1 Tax=Sylvanvirus sp. TaxID=2487774 RepID=A0A3G5AH59_9VIRU|nr:MAG: hypothetical protein Sylvanvirus2_38 [Sylvanvirus sp.]